MAEAQPARPIQTQVPVSGLRAPQPLNVDSNIAENWRLFKQKWHNYAIITNLPQQAREYQVALFLHTIGDEALKVYNGFKFDTPDAVRTVDDIIQKFEIFAIGEINETYERYVFNRRDQMEGESFEAFLTVIRSLVKTCKYCDDCVNSLLRDRIVLGIRDVTTQQILLRERALTLEKTIDICKSAENAVLQGKMFRAETINRVDTRMKQNVKTSHESSKTVTKKHEISCRFCGRRHAKVRQQCPAWGQECNKCGKANHFAKQCKTKKLTASTFVRNVDHTEDVSSNSDSSEVFVNVVSHNPSRDIKCEMIVADRRVTFLVDTGASANLLPLCNLPKTAVVSPTDRQLTMWNGTQLSPVGTCRIWLRNPSNKKRYNVEFVIVKEKLTPLIGLSAAEQMKLLTVNECNLHRVAAVGLSDEQNDVYDRPLGTLPGEVHLRVDNSVVPVVMPARRIPIAIRSKLREELDRLTKLGVITPVDQPTPWVSQIVVTQKKSGDLRICLDPKELNKALLRERFQLPVLDDVLHELGHSKVFTKADLSSGYWHVQLDTESSLLTTFQTCFGRFRFCRLPFGLSVSAEIFQRKLLEALDNLTNVVCIADDVIIHGKDTEQHDLYLQKFMQRCHDKGIKLNRDKLELRMKEITFMGHRITQDGLQPDPDKVKAVLELDTPQNVEQLRRFLGIVNYLGHFLSHLTEVARPLHNLIRHNVTWMWSDVQEQAFNAIKKLVTSAPILTYYDCHKPLTIQNDASEYGIGSVIFQDGRPIAYASRILTDIESRYAQIEKEMLALTYGLEKFNQYTFGRHVNVITDHKPLVSIVTKPLMKAPKRLQSLLLRCQKYDYTLQYQPGKSIPVADALSRAPLNDKTKSAEEVFTVSNVNFSPINSSRLNDIRIATDLDYTLQQLKEMILRGWPTHSSAVPSDIAVFFDYRDELTVQDGIILRGDRVVIPVSLRSDMKQRVHAGHLGINSCLRRARELIYWPGMTRDIRQYVQACPVCATYPDKQPPESLKRHDLPERPWQKVGTDLFTFCDRNYLITVDYFSNFIEVDYLPDTLSRTVVTKMKLQFARYGIPDILISDGGPQYTSSEFKLFSKQWSFEHHVTSPANSKANGAAEAAVKIVKRMMRKCKLQHEDPYLGLLNIRNTVNEGWRSSPSQRMFGRATKTLLPTIASHLLQSKVITADDRDRVVKRRADEASRFNQHARDLKPLPVGSSVRIQPSGLFSHAWRQGVITKQCTSRTYDVKTEDGSVLTRSRQFIRPTHHLSSDCQSTPSEKHLPHTQNIQKSSMSPVAEQSETDNVSRPPTSVTTTRSGRLSKAPPRLDL